MATLAIILIGGGLLAGNALSDPGVTDSSSSASRENDSVNVKAEHHYNSPAERANDNISAGEARN